MEKHIKKIHPNILIGLVVVIFCVIGFFIFKNVSNTTTSKNGVYDKFAQCITESGAQFYGAYWCPACNAQKERFGTSAKLLPFVECATPPNDRNQNMLCKQDKIEAYPTWRFKDGSEVSENLSFEQLSEKTGCSFPK